MANRRRIAHPKAWKPGGKGYSVDHAQASREGSQLRLLCDSPHKAYQFLADLETFEMPDIPAYQELHIGEETFPAVFVVYGEFFRMDANPDKGYPARLNFRVHSSPGKHTHILLTIQFATVTLDPEEQESLQRLMTALKADHFHFESLQRQRDNEVIGTVVHVVLPHDWTVGGYEVADTSDEEWDVIPPSDEDWEVIPEPPPSDLVGALTDWS